MNFNDIFVDNVLVKIKNIEFRKWLFYLLLYFFL